jgi:hypothetical protein
VTKWVLKIELNGEWEECSFQTRNEALSAFAALATDYNVSLHRAVLFASSLRHKYFDLRRKSTGSGLEYLN